MKVQVTKCYLVQVLDDKGNELACRYVFCDKKEALQIGKELKAEIKEEKNT